MDIIERAARALCEHKAYDWPSGADMQEQWKDQARAVLQAIREPTEDMMAASNRIPHARDEEIYQAMIDAALLGKGE